jgi:formylmethanofuran dehydrogenase subunit E
MTIICEKCGETVEIKKKSGKQQKYCTECANSRRKTVRRNGTKWEK